MLSLITSFEVDIILLGTGYVSNLESFIDEKILKIINYNIDNKYAPVNLAYDFSSSNKKPSFRRNRFLFNIFYI
jgi:hypothetical protein